MAEAHSTWLGETLHRSLSYRKRRIHLISATPLGRARGGPAGGLHRHHAGPCAGRGDAEAAKGVRVVVTPQVASPLLASLNLHLLHRRHVNPDGHVFNPSPVAAQTTQLFLDREQSLSCGVV